MITGAPLPRWLDLIKLLKPKKLDENELAKPWMKTNDIAFWTSGSSWSLYAIVMYYERIFSKKNPCVWVPDYFCNRTLLLMRQIPATIVFYPIDQSFNPKWLVCEKMIDNKPDIFIFVHYFGFVGEIKKAKLFCEEHHAVLIEDAAHFSIPIEGIGETGHIVTYSPHKHFAIPDGAVCIIRPSFKKFVKSITGSSFNTYEIFNEIGKKRPAYMSWLFKSIIKKILGKYCRLFKKNIAYDIDPVAEAVYMTPHMSKTAKKLLQSSLPYIPHYVKHRQTIVEIWNYLLEQNGIALKRVRPTNSGLPYVGIYQAENLQAKKIYNFLNKNGWPVSTWPDLPLEVRNNSSLYTTAIYNRNNMMTLPVHQTLKVKEIVKQYGIKLNRCHQGYYIHQVENKVWELFFSKIPKSNLSQSCCYGEAKTMTDGWIVEYFIIKKQETDIALIQIRKKKIGLITLVRVNRGPLWLSDHKTFENMRGVFLLLKLRYSISKKCIFIIFPDLISTPSNIVFMKQLGFRKIGLKKTGSIWIDLSNSEQDLRKALRGNWRRELAAAEKKKLIFEELDNEKDAKWLIEKYISFQREKKFVGTNPVLIHNLLNISMKDLDCQHALFQVSLDNEPLAAGLIAKHGLACTYYFIWIDKNIGREANVGYYFLWNAILSMKKKGCLWFDLGGISDQDPSASAITAFKRGLSGDEYWLMGDYIAF